MIGVPSEQCPPWQTLGIGALRLPHGWLVYTYHNVYCDKSHQRWTRRLGSCRNVLKSLCAVMTGLSAVPSSLKSPCTSLRFTRRRLSTNETPLTSSLNVMCPACPSSCNCQLGCQTWQLPGLLHNRALEQRPQKLRSIFPVSASDSQKLIVCGANEPHSIAATSPKPRNTF